MVSKKIAALTAVVFVGLSGATSAAAAAQALRDDVLVIVNDNSIDSPQLGAYYAQQRGIDPANIVHVRVPNSYFISWDTADITPGPYTLRLAVTSLNEAGGRSQTLNDYYPVLVEIPEDQDNCIEVTNTDQRDTDGDGYGNLCGGDLNNDGSTNTLDLNLYKQAYRTSVGDANYNADADFNGDGAINTLDLNIYKGLHRKPPGPSCCGLFWEPVREPGFS